jgi:glycosyltransferase involved in cell wall biosynthesis
MWVLVLQNHKTKYLLIDTYSSQAFWFAITTALLARLFKLPYIPVLHGGDLPKRKKRSPVILRYFLKGAAHVVCPSGYLQFEMNDFYPRDYVLIPNFIDLKNYPLYPKSAGMGIRLLWVRSFHEIYNPCLAIDLLELLSERGLDAYLAMVGPDKDGSLEKTKKYAEEKGVLHRVRFTRGLSNEEWIEFSKDYNIFINTTDVDNTPVSVMEAMALGFPVISTNVGGLPFLIDSGVDGILVNMGNAESFADQITCLGNDSVLFETLARNARQKAEAFDWLQVGEKWLALLNTTPE